MRRILLFPQDKGGVGKSFVATLLHDYFVAAGVSLKAFDLDHANSTFHRFVPDSEFIDTDVDTSRLGVLDRLVHALEEADVVLVDNRASGGEKVLHYLRDTQLTSLQDELDCRLIFVVIATDDKDANSQIADLVDEYADHVGWLIARNHRDGAGLALFDASRSRERLLKLGGVEVTIPALAEVTRNRLQLANLTVRRGRDSEELHLLDRSRCTRYHDAMRSELDKARYLLGE